MQNPRKGSDATEEQAFPLVMKMNNLKSIFMEFQVQRVSFGN